MKVVSTDALTKLIQLIKGTFIKNTDVVQTTEVTLANVATTGAYSDLSGTPSTFTGADGTNAGTSGLVPAPTATDNTKYLKGDGTWTTVDALPSQTSQSGKFLTTNGTSASWGNLSSTNVTTALGYTPADDSDVVKTSGSQTVNGTKTFINSIKAKGGFDVINTNATKGTNPASTVYWGLFRANDSTDSSTWANTRLGIGEVSLDANGNTKLMLGVYRNEAGATANSNLSIIYDKVNGTRYCTLSETPATGDDSTKIATTAFVKAQNYLSQSNTYYDSSTKTLYIG